MKVTKDERVVINELKRLAKKWPKTLWLYSASGELNVMKCGKDGYPVMKGEGVDQDYIIDTIDIPNDGGDW